VAESAVIFQIPALDLVPLGVPSASNPLIQQVPPLGPHGERTQLDKGSRNESILEPSTSWGGEFRIGITDKNVSQFDQYVVSHEKVADVILAKSQL